MISKTKLLSFNLETLDQYFERLLTTTGHETANMIEALSDRQARKLNQWLNNAKTDKAEMIRKMIIELR